MLWQIERRLSKDEILELYLTLTPMEEIWKGFARLAGAISAMKQIVCLMMKLQY